MRVLLALVVACHGGGSSGDLRPAPEPASWVQITVDAHGLGALEVEPHVAIPLELAVSGIPGAVRVRSRSVFGAAEVVVWFDRGDAWTARQAVVERLRDADLPAGIHAQIGRNAGERVALRYLVRGPAMTARAFADWTLERELETIAGVAAVDARGGAVEQIHVMLDPARLAELGVMPDDVVRAIGGAADDGSQIVRSTGALHGVDEVAGALVRAGIRVRDVASVRLAPAPRDCAVADARDDDLVEGIVWARAGADVAAVRRLAGARLAAVAAPEGVAVEPLELDGETRVDAPGELDAVRAVRDAVRAVPGEIVVERCRPLAGAPELGDDVRVLSASADRAAIAARAASVAGAIAVPDDAIAIRVTGPDLDELDRLAHAVVDAAHRAGARATAPGARTPREQLTLDRGRLAQHGIDADGATRAAELALGGATAAEATIGNRRVDVVVRTPAPRSLADVPVAASVRIGDVATIAHAEEPRVIEREDGARSVTVRVIGGDAAALRTALAAIRLPAGYALRFDASSRA